MRQFREARAGFELATPVTQTGVQPGYDLTFGIELGMQTAVTRRLSPGR